MGKDVPWAKLFRFYLTCRASGILRNARADYTDALDCADRLYRRQHLRLILAILTELCNLAMG